jgi:hypothetical protein
VRLVQLVLRQMHSVDLHNSTAAVSTTCPDQEQLVLIRWMPRLHVDSHEMQQQICTAVDVSKHVTAIAHLLLCLAAGCAGSGGSDS